MEKELNFFEAFRLQLLEKAFPCVAARDALAKENIEIFVADHLACPKDDAAILQFLYSFVQKFRTASKGFYSAVVLFPQTHSLTEQEYEQYLFNRLKSLRQMDAKLYKYDERVDSDPASEKFSFSLKEEAFFIIGLHPQSSRPARQFPHAAIVFNPHVQFENLRAENKYEKMKQIVRTRDMQYSGSNNPMLTDFGSRSEVYQYSGMHYAANDKCPFQPQIIIK